MSSDIPAPRVRSARRRAITSLVAAGTVASTVAAVGTGGPIVEAGVVAPIQVQILAFNDYHGHVERDTANFAGDEGGGEFLSAKLTELRDDGLAAGYSGSITVAAGDNIGGSPFFSGLFQDEPSVETLNAMGLDYSGVGNHEFDEGVDELLRMQNGGCFDTDADGVTAGPADGGSAEAIDDCFFPDDPYQGASFDWLAANVTEDNPDGTDDFEDSIEDWAIEEIQGQKIGIIGMTLEGTDAIVAAAGIAGFTFEDEIEAGNAAVEAIQAADPTVSAIIVLLHEGGFPAPVELNGCQGLTGPINAIAAGLDAEIDAIFTGHTQLPYNCELPDPDGVLRPVTSAHEFGKVVTEVVVTFGPDGDIVRPGISATNHAVIHSEIAPPGEYDADGNLNPEYTPDQAITDVIEKWQPLADEVALEEVGRISEDITRAGDPTGSDRGLESSAGNLVADAQLFSILESDIEADVAFMNPGGVRSDLTFEASGTETEDGIVTYGEAFTFQPFNNTLAVLPMTGAQIKQVLLEQCQPPGGRPVLHLGVSEGFSYDLDITIDNGTCTEILIRDVELNGVDVVDTETYNVVTNVFLADGGDNFATFAEVDPTDRIPGPQDIDALTSYLLANSPVAAPGTDRVNEGPFPPGATALAPGRILDTRDGGQTVDNLFEAEGPLAAGDTIELQVTGRAGVDDDAESVVLNIGVIRPEDLGFVTVYPCDEDVPNASNLNFVGGTTVSNAVSTKLSADGTACIFSSVETHLYADVTSSVAPGGSPSAISPSRVLDTRVGGQTIDGQHMEVGLLAGGEIYELAVVGREDADGNPLIPANANAVTLNVGAIQPADKGYLTVFPCNDTDTPPNASNVNYIAGVNVANAVTVGIGDEGAVCIFSFADTHLIADVTGFVPANGSPDPLEPARLIDTRDEFPVTTVDGERVGEGMIAADEVVTLQVAGRGGVNDDATSANLNVTAVRPVAGGFMTIYPCTDDVPNASQVNFAGVDNVANSVSALLTDDGTVCIVSSVETHLLVDVTGSAGPEPVSSFTQDAPAPV